MKVWFDACTGKHIRYGAAIGERLKETGHDFIFTTREHPDTIPLSKILNEKPLVVGKYNPATLNTRLRESAERVLEFSRLFKDNKPDIAISHQSVELCRTAFGLGIPIILTADTPHAISVNRLTLPFANTVILLKLFQEVSQKIIVSKSLFDSKVLTKSLGFKVLNQKK